MLTDLVSEGLGRSPSAIAYRFAQAIRAAYPQHYVMQTESSDFELETWAQRTGRALEVHADPMPDIIHHWRGPERGLSESFAVGRRSVTFDGENIEVFDITWQDGFCATERRWWLGRSPERVKALVNEVVEVANKLDDEVLVFAFGEWQRDKELRASIRSTTFESLVLPPGAKETMLEDFRSFLSSKEEYDRYGVPWKRGALFLGPPGNGKTHCVKALLNALDLPCLYVRSFESHNVPNQYTISQVFDRARKTAPCVLVLEDLDSLVTPRTRAVFLNELDGFASNEGIVTIATANYPERLDPAIVDRPSRFDRKYTFSLPEEGERLDYLRWWKARLTDEAPLDDAAIELAAKASYAAWVSASSRSTCANRRVASQMSSQPEDEEAFRKVKGRAARR